ncbi:MAG: GAF domain-containing protein [Bacteroidales bacterium]|nr:GAF domain-containing protein [Bacteroidales bacterium]
MLDENEEKFAYNEEKLNFIINHLNIDSKEIADLFGVKASYVSKLLNYSYTTLKPMHLYAFTGAYAIPHKIFDKSIKTSTQVIELLEEQKKEEKELLILEAAYAYDKKKLLDTEIEIGESLVGKCAKEQKLIRIDDLPEGYTYISSGLGEDTPKSLILSPLMYEKKLFGVLEIASLKKLPDYKINFLNIIAERIAAEISNINSKKLRAKLAEDYKKQSEELSLEEKKAEDKITELIKEKELITNKYKIISEDIELINMTVPSIIFDSKGIIKKINKAAEKLYNIKKEDILNKNGKDIFTENHKFSDLFNKVLKGEIQYNRFFNEKRTEETAEQYIPVKEKNAEIQKVILTAMKIKRT